MKNPQLCWGVPFPAEYHRMLLVRHLARGLRLRSAGSAAVCIQVVLCHCLDAAGHYAWTGPATGKKKGRPEAAFLSGLCLAEAGSAFEPVRDVMFDPAGIEPFQRLNRQP
jgi:hypothetical protein